MKKSALTLATTLIMSGALYAQTLNVQDGWQLVGATENVELSKLNGNCIDYIWQYDATNEDWKLHVANGQIYAYTGATVMGINAGEGFWVKGNGVCNMEISNTGTASDANVTTGTASTLAFGSFITAYGFEEGDSDWYSHFSFATTPFTGTDYEYTGSSWEIEEDGTFSGTVTKNSDHNISIFESTEGFGADIIFTQTEQITAIDGVSYTDLYLTDIEVHVTAIGSGWTDDWGWTPTYWDGTNNVNVTTNPQLLTMYLTQNSWVGGDSTYAMLDGANGDTSGNIVKGVFAGYCDNTGDSVPDTDCKMVNRTSEIIEGASWSYGTAGIFIDLPNETQTISLSSSGTVQSVGNDKIGSVWHEKWLTGSEATEAVVQKLLE